MSCPRCGTKLRLDYEVTSEGYRNGNYHRTEHTKVSCPKCNWPQEEKVIE